MSERRTLSLRGPTERKDVVAPRRSWNVSETRRERLKAMARDQRRHPSEAEKALWARLGNQKLGGFKFHRQVVVGSTIADFACPARWLVVEIGGEANAEVAAIQDRKLADVGIRVLRFTEAQVLEEIDTVLAAVLEELKKPFDRRAQRAANAAGRPVDRAGELAGGREIPEADQAEDEALFATDTDDGDDENENQNDNGGAGESRAEARLSDNHAADR